MKYILISCIIVFFQQNIDINALKKNSIMIQYKKVSNELKNAALNRKYKLPRDINLNKELANDPTKEGMTILLKEKGMINAEEFVNKLFLQTTLMFEFIKKHPEIAKLDPKSKMELVTNLLQD